MIYLFQTTFSKLLNLVTNLNNHLKALLTGLKTSHWSQISHTAGNIKSCRAVITVSNTSNNGTQRVWIAPGGLFIHFTTIN